MLRICLKKDDDILKVQENYLSKKVPKGSGYQRLYSSSGSHRNKRREITAEKT